MPLSALALLVAARIEAQQARDLAPYLISDHAAEVRLARSAAPKHVSDSATVLVLTGNGFAEAVRGTNGFTCLVVRSFSSRVDDPNYWNPRIRAPHCFNPPATRTVLQEILKSSEWVMGGVKPTEIADRTERAYASHELSMPAVGAMVFTLSPNQYLQDTDPHAVPHLMFYYDKSMPVTAWGVGGATATVIDGSAGDEHAPFVTLIIPVRRWSDGTSALPAARHDHWGRNA